MKSCTWWILWGLFVSVIIKITYALPEGAIFYITNVLAGFAIGLMSTRFATWAEAPIKALLNWFKPRTTEQGGKEVNHG